MFHQKGVYTRGGGNLWPLCGLLQRGWAGGEQGKVAATCLGSCSFIKRRSKPHCVLDTMDAKVVLVLRTSQPTSHWG